MRICIDIDTFPCRYCWLIALGGAVFTLAADEWMKWHFRSRAETKQRFRAVREDISRVLVTVEALGTHVSRLEGRLQRLDNVH